jgi:hypothetical protein
MEIEVTVKHTICTHTNHTIHKLVKISMQERSCVINQSVIPQNYKIKINKQKQLILSIIILHAQGLKPYIQNQMGLIYLPVLIFSVSI